MNYLDVIKSIDHIIKTDNNLNDNNCILVNGEWGIGKTYAVNEWIKNNEADYNVKYISVFGKSSARDIENAILIKLAGLVDTKASAKDKSIKSRFNLVVSARVRRFVCAEQNAYVMTRGTVLLVESNCPK